MSKQDIVKKLTGLSEKAHEVAKVENPEQISKIEEEIDEVAAQIWRLSKEELKDIALSLKELGK